MKIQNALSTGFALTLALSTFLGSKSFSSDHAINEQAAHSDYNYNLNLFDSFTELNMCRYVSGIKLAPTHKKVVLTFDDGPDLKNTPRVLEILNRYNIKATFFVVAEKLVKSKYPLKESKNASHRKLVQAVTNAGHIIANHSYSHATFSLIDDVTAKKEIDQSTEILKPYMKLQKVKMFRYPYGSASCFSNDYILNQKKYTGILGWHVDTCDWGYAKTGTVTNTVALRDCGIRPENVSNYSGHVLSQLNKRGGGVILMHEIHNRTVDSLEQTIKNIINEGYHFTNMNDPDMQIYLKSTI